MLGSAAAVVALERSAVAVAATEAAVGRAGSGITGAAGRRSAVDDDDALATASRHKQHYNGRSSSSSSCDCRGPASCQRRRATAACPGSPLCVG